jgi:hypothetical protein
VFVTKALAGVLLVATVAGLVTTGPRLTVYAPTADGHDRDRGGPATVAQPGQAPEPERNDDTPVTSGEPVPNVPAPSDETPVPAPADTSPTPTTGAVPTTTTTVAPSTTAPAPAPTQAPAPTTAPTPAPRPNPAPAPAPTQAPAPAPTTAPAAPATPPTTVVRPVLPPPTTPASVPNWDDLEDPWRPPPNDGATCVTRTITLPDGRTATETVCT